MSRNFSRGDNDSQRGKQRQINDGCELCGGYDSVVKNKTKPCRASIDTSYVYYSDANVFIRVALRKQSFFYRRVDEHLSFH